MQAGCWLVTNNMKGQPFTQESCKTKILSHLLVVDVYAYALPCMPATQRLARWLFPFRAPQTFAICMFNQCTGILQADIIQLVHESAVTTANNVDTLWLPLTNLYVLLNSSC
jgi:hypothetical protein